MYSCLSWDRLQHLINWMDGWMDVTWCLAKGLKKMSRGQKILMGQEEKINPVDSWSLVLSSVIIYRLNAREDALG